MRNLNCPVLSGLNSGSVTGTAIDSSQLLTASFQLVFGDATAAGSFIVQASNDEYDTRYLPQDFTPSNWSNIGTASTVAAGANGLIFLVNMSYRWIRVLYTSTTPGTTTVIVNMNALGQ